MEERRKRGGHRERAEGESVLISRATKRRIAYSGVNDGAKIEEEGRNRKEKLSSFSFQSSLLE